MVNRLGNGYSCHIWPYEVYADVYVFHQVLLSTGLILILLVITRNMTIYGCCICSVATVVMISHRLQIYTSRWLSLMA